MAFPYRQEKVQPKKSLGQHFLHDLNLARKIVDSLQTRGNVLEVGPGMGVLTQFLMEKGYDELKVIDIDRESIAWLHKHFPALSPNIIEGDFLALDLSKVFEKDFAVIGNFPYNISSQIFFKILDHKGAVKEVVCMLQKEVADRIAEKPGNKTYGILSVLLQAYYDVKMLFKVPPGAFHPPPKVMSAVIRLTRNNRVKLDCDEKLFHQVVKQGFNNRRKTLRNALKNLNLAADVSAWSLLDKRAEQLSVEDFISLTKKIEDSRAGTTSRV